MKKVKENQGQKVEEIHNKVIEIYYKKIRDRLLMKNRK